MFGLLKKVFGTSQSRRIRRYRKIVEEVNRWEEKYRSLTDEQLRAKTEEFRQRFAEGETLDALLPEAFAVVKNVCRRLVGTEMHLFGYDQKWDMVPYDVQIIGAITLHEGCIAEMQTGEGKTLTAVMPLYLNALTGNPVHLVTVNDYLAKRDCQWMGVIFNWLGLTVGALTNETPMGERRSLYQSDILYGTASEFGFDYLRDNSMAFSKEMQVQRGFFFTIIDEVDSILIDEARTPLIISGPSPVSRQMYEELKEGVADLVRGQRDLCNRIASEAFAVLKDKWTSAAELEAEGKTVKFSDEEKEALRKLWLVSKGMPRNKVVKRVKEDPDMRAALEQWDLYYHSDANKEERHEALAELYMVVDEKSHEYELTDKGMAAWQGEAGSEDFVMLDISEGFLKIDQDPALSDEQKMEQRLALQEEDAKRKERTHNIRQLLRAHLMMERDVDYIVQEGKIVIIDENTGRPQPGRRFADGLHQAIEAKEGLKVQSETQTYATITLQNFFRMYDKTAGMTGTAMTEAAEFKQIYEMDVVEIPTHRPCIRVDKNDEIYMTEREKYQAILKEVQRAHAEGRPILIGTESVDVSEKLSRIFKRHNLPHTVLNAKNHEKEAEIVAAAGKRGAITIATNMAGRGTDIKLEKVVAELGGLYVIGSTRHQSRRIDRQLRGRGARQGDPGSSAFYISFEDPLLRLFASPRMTALLQRFRPPEGEPISAKILNRSIETAQKRVEQRNYMIRKHTLDYDDVMNRQRQEIYAFRNEILHADDLMPLAIDLIESVCEQGTEPFYTSRSGGWDFEGYRNWLMHQFPVSFEKGIFDLEDLDMEGAVQIASERVAAAFCAKIEQENSKVIEGNSAFRPGDEAVRNLMIRIIDNRWQEHLLAMDHLRADVSLRAVGQRDPLMEFKHEAFRIFADFSQKIYEEITHAFFRFEIAPQGGSVIQELMADLRLEKGRSFTGELEGEEPPLAQASPNKIEPVVAPLKVNRNEPCPCGSGKKFKRCCGAHREVDALEPSH